MGEAERAIATLKLTREMLAGFSNLIEALRRGSDAHRVSLKDVRTGGSMGKELVEALPPEKLGLLIKAISGMGSLHAGLENFMSYDTFQLDELNGELKSTIQDFDHVLEGL